jgi:hypothetical protein
MSRQSELHDQQDFPKCHETGHRSITLETNVWENDWRLVLNTGRIEELLERCHYQFDTCTKISQSKNGSAV